MAGWEVRSDLAYPPINANVAYAAMPVGSYGKETVNLNVDSLWHGGPFEDPVTDHTP
jgi:hypothetical protein